MDEELLDIITEENIEVAGAEVVETNVSINDEEIDISTKETVEIVEIESTEEIEIEVDESIGWVGGDSTKHYSLLGRNDPNQHEIKAITGLREELDKIQALKTVYSDKINISNYYAWNDGAYDEHGYFVSLVSDTSMIKICDGSDILGVTVDTAGFIGGQNADVPRNNTYGLVVTSGLVDVRCELDVKVGDYVVSNMRGYARKSSSNYGYKVFAREIKNGVEYALIMLGVQADVTNALGKDLNVIDSRLDVAEKNIVSAINVANQAYNKSADATAFSEKALIDALKALANSETSADIVKDAYNVAQNAGNIAVQARAISENAVNEATTLKNEATTRANDAWAKANEAQEEAYSLCAKIDQYSVGEYSQAYGLTWEQAQSILKPGMIYAPTKHTGVETYHTESYKYTNNVETWSEFDNDQSKVYYNKDTKKYIYYHNGERFESSDMPSYTRIFTPEYLYQWGYLPSLQRYGWITIDKTHQLVHYESIVEINEASKSVFFTFKEPAMEAGDFGYWYTDGEQIEDINGVIGTYEPYTLYKWETDHWLAVATLSGNVNNRMVSEFSQTTNDIMLGLINARGGIAAFNAQLTETEAITQQTAQWTKGSDENGNVLSYNLAAIEQKADNGGSNIVLAVADKNGNKVLSGASIVLSQDNNDSFISFDAENINFDTSAFAVRDSSNNGNVLLFAGNGKVDIGKFTVSANNDISYLYANNKKSYSDETDGVYLGTNGIGLGAGKFYVKDDGYLYSKYGTIGGWEIGTDCLEAKEDATGRLALFSPSADSDYWLQTYNKENNNFPFSISRDGKLHANGGTIGGWEISTDCLTASKDKIDFTLYSPDANSDFWLRTFNRDKGGSVIFAINRDGTLKANGGTIGGWEISTDRIYANFIAADPNDPYNGEISLGKNGIKLQEENNLNYVDISPRGITLFMPENSTLTGSYMGLPKWIDIFGDSLCFTLGTQGDTTDVAYIGFGNGTEYPMIGSKPTTNELNFVICATTSSTAYLLGSWQLDTTEGVISDARYKNTITDFKDEYELFFDSLQPRLYKYNYGTSGRTHFGFIAQEVAESVEAAGLSLQDTAVVCRPDSDLGSWSIRYGEFVSLNTWQIQKLKPRVSALEEKVQALEAENAELKEKIDQLLNQKQ